MDRSARMVFGLGAAAVITLLTACLDAGSTDEGGSDVESDAASGGEATIEFWSMPFWPQNVEKISDLVNEFNATHDVTVEFTALEWQDGREKIKQAVAAGTGPDVFLMNNGLDLDYLTSGSLASLDEVGYTDDDIDAYLPLIEANEYEGKLYGAPMYWFTDVLYYRPDVLAEYGYDSPPATWAQLREIAKAITDSSSKEIWGWQFKGMDDHLNAIRNTWLSFLTQSGGQLMDDAMSNSAQSSQPAEETLAFMKSFYDEGISPVGTSAEDGFVSGNVAMFSFVQNITLDEMADSLEWAIAPMPEGPDNGGSLMAGHSLVANAASDNLAAAGEFMRWLSSPKQAITYMDGFRAIFPYDLSAMPEEIVTEVQSRIDAEDYWVPILEQLERNDPSILLQDRYAATARASAQAANVIAAVNGQQSITDALEAIDNEVDEALDAD